MRLLTIVANLIAVNTGSLVAALVGNLATQREIRRMNKRIERERKIEEFWRKHLGRSAH